MGRCTRPRLGGEGTGPNPTDRGKTGWKWSVATDTNGVPSVGQRGANRNDSVLLAPTLDDIDERGLLSEIETMWLDRGYDSGLTRTRLAERGITDAVMPRSARGDQSEGAKRQPMGLRWPVERTNSWLSNFGQLRRNTDRFSAHRLAQFALAVALIITVKLVNGQRDGTPWPSPNGARSYLVLSQVIRSFDLDPFRPSHVHEKTELVQARAHPLRCHPEETADGPRRPRPGW